MLVISFESGRQHYWHRGQDRSIAHILTEDTVKEVQADGDELEYIKLHITGIPISYKRVVVWYGDHAKFIAQNL